MSAYHYEDVLKALDMCSPQRFSILAAIQPHNTASVPFLVNVTGVPTEDVWWDLYNLEFDGLIKTDAAIVDGKSQTVAMLATAGVRAAIEGRPLHAEDKSWLRFIKPLLGRKATG